MKMSRRGTRQLESKAGSKIYNGSHIEDVSMLDFNRNTDEASTVNKKTRDIVIDNLSKQEILLDSNYDDSQN